MRGTGGTDPTGGLVEAMPVGRVFEPYGLREQRMIPPGGVRGNAPKLQINLFESNPVTQSGESYV